MPDAATWPYSLLVAAVAHEPDVPALGPDERDGLAATLVDVLGRLDALFDAPMPYMLWFHQRPSDGGPWPTAHLHLHLAPLYRSPGTQRYVALKHLVLGRLASEAMRGRFEREIQAAASLDHPHIVTIFAVGEGGPDNEPYVALEYLEGQTLRERMYMQLYCK